MPSQEGSACPREVRDCGGSSTNSGSLELLAPPILVHVRCDQMGFSKIVTSDVKAKSILILPFHTSESYENRKELAHPSCV